MKLEAIILAAGSGNRMVELTRNRPKCLLPVGNHCLIWFAITGLRLVGVNRMIILVPDIYESDIKQYCNKKFSSFKNLSLEFVSVSAEADCGTAESIYDIKDKISGDFIVHSCDSIVDPTAIFSLINHYRLYDPMMTMLLADNAKYFHSRSVPGKKSKESYNRDVIAVEPLEKLELTAGNGYRSYKVVFIQSELDIKENLKIRNNELALHPSLEIHSTFLDTHIYIFKKLMLDFMGQHKDKAMMKDEMIPLLVSKQFRIINQNEDDDELKRRRNCNDFETELKEKLESFDPRNLVQLSISNPKPRPLRPTCHALVVDKVYAYRVNNIGSYIDSNRESKAIMTTLGVKNLTAVKDCLLGENTTIGDKCIIKKGSIGNNCKIGDKVKLFDCVIMDNVEIDSNTSLSECIVGSNSRIGTKCDLKSCIIGCRQTVIDDRKSNGELIMDEYMI